MTETYPKTIHKLPTRIIRDHDVLAWMLAKNRAGSYPGGYVLAHNPAEVQPYVVWEVCTRDGGETWHVTGSGDYSRTYGDAALKFMFRLSGNDIATEALTEPDMDTRTLEIGCPWRDGKMPTREDCAMNGCTSCNNPA